MIHTLGSDLPTQLWIGGTPRAASNGATFAVRDPATETVLAEVADATPEDGLLALDAAVASRDEWASTLPRERAEILRSPERTRPCQGGRVRSGDDAGNGQAAR